LTHSINIKNCGKQNLADLVSFPNFHYLQSVMALEYWANDVEGLGAKVTSDPLSGIRV